MKFGTSDSGSSHIEATQACSAFPPPASVSVWKTGFRANLVLLLTQDGLLVQLRLSHLHDHASQMLSVARSGSISELRMLWHSLNL